MTAAWAVELPAGEKLVLLALADCANDEGHCWPGLTSLSRKTGKCKRSLQESLRMLDKSGHITREENPGKGMNYTVHPVAKSAPVEEVATGSKNKCRPVAKSAPKPLRTINSEAKASSSVGKHLIPSDWSAPSVDELPPRSRACAEQWNDDSYQTEAEAFLLYWQSERKLKHDWRATWANRVIARHSAVMRDQKYGNGPGSLKAERYVSASGHVYRGSLEDVMREATRRGDTQTYWLASSDLNRRAIA